MTTVIITEKPDAMEKIAHSLSVRPKRVKSKQFYWYELERGKQKIIVTSAVGHLFALDTVKKKGWTYPVFDMQWVPSYTKKGSEFSKKYFETISQAVKAGDDFVVATDFDTEGEVIGYNILNFIAKTTDARRMKFSSMTKDELTEAFEHTMPTIFFSQVEAGLTRHYLDFMWGVNLTRALSLSVKNAGKMFAVLSTGRVQGPTLFLLYQKEQEIKNFKPVPFWQLLLKLKNGIVAEYEEGRIWKKEKADRIFQESQGNATVSSVKKNEYKQPPPAPFNTTDLQAEAYNQFRFSPTQTLLIAESLYQAGHISYPRSSSQKLPANINYAKVLRALNGMQPYQKLSGMLLSKGKLAPVEGKRDDPAHPAIYPTPETPSMQSLTSQQRKIYDLIARRFMAVFADDAVRESTTVVMNVGGNNFVAVGKKTVEAGWTGFYKPYVSAEEAELPELEAGDELEVSDVEQAEKQTQPPGRYTQGSIVKEMEKRDLGTRATRAEILNTLYARKYIVGQSIQVTNLGEAVVNALKSYSPRILSEDLTRKFEDETEQVLSGRLKREQVVSEAQNALVGILKEFKEKETEIGQALVGSLSEARRREKTLGTCVNCKTGELKVLRSKTGKFFVGCSNFFRCANCGSNKKECKCGAFASTCKTAYPLPGKAKIIPTGNTCDKCGTPVINAWRAGRRPFKMCINPQCETKSSWAKKLCPIIL